MLKRLSGFLLAYFCIVGFCFAQSYSLSDFLKTPYISNLAANPVNGDVCFVVNRLGIRNVYKSAHPYTNTQQLTNFNTDDGQELSSLNISKDGKWAIFVRGGDHGGNGAVRPINPNSGIGATKITLYSINLSSGEVKPLSEGDYPVINPQSNTVAFINKDQVWSVPIDGNAAAKQLFYVKGSPKALQWSPNGKKIAFASRRGTHSFIGIFDESVDRIKWLAPSFERDDFPQWSPDGNNIAFIRQPAAGGKVDSVTVRKHKPWAIMVADIEGKNITEIWQAPKTLEGSYPAWQGGANLSWPTADRLVFLSYQDGWPHLYSIQPNGHNFLQLTKGNFTVDQVNFTDDGKQITFAANFGNDRKDIDRKHIGIINTDGTQFKMLTKGDHIGSSPIFINANKQIAYIRSTSTQPPSPAIVDVAQHTTSLNIAAAFFKDFDYTNLISPQQVMLKSTDNLQLYAQLFKPKNAKGKVPAVVYVHGGPRRQMFLGWHFMDYYFYDYAVNQFLASKGIAVLAINYRMGTGYGYQFQNPDSVGVLGAAEYKDILAAGKWLTQQKDIDIDRIGIFGGSYGGYLTAFALAKNSDVFKVGVDIHGVHNREVRKTDEPLPPDASLAAQLAWDSSPSKYVDTWKSPVLIIHGDDDQNVAFTQSLDLANRLRDRNVKMEYLVVPDETHHWMVFSNLLTVKNAAAEFLMKYLLPPNK
jgi:dipeptidyl aminopeptidase/acylaminoacyl peptidase